LVGDRVLPKKKIVQLSKKTVDKALKEQKETIKEHSPLEKAKKAYHEAVEEKKPEDESSTSDSTDSNQDKKTPDPTPEPKEPTPTPHTGDLSVMVDKSYDQIKRTTRGLSAAASSLFGQSFGTENSTQTENTDTHTSGSNEDAIALARKILERKKKEKIDE
jgi:hypothetical protein